MAANEKPADGQMEAAFLAIMDAVRPLPTEQARFTVVNWAYEALDQRPGPLSETGGRRPLPPLPGALYGVRHGSIILRQRFLSEKSAEGWALENYKNNRDAFEVVQIAPDSGRDPSR